MSRDRLLDISSGLVVPASICDLLESSGPLVPIVSNMILFDNNLFTPLKHFLFTFLFVQVCLCYEVCVVVRGTSAGIGSPFCRGDLGD